MKRTFFYFSFVAVVIFFSLFMTQCAKEYSYEGGSSAQYTFLGSPNECLETVLNGSYYEGIATDSGNSIQLTAYVTLAGNYNIATGTVNGISFSSGGNFSDTGYQLVTLKCSGTPVDSGTFTFTVPGVDGCNFTVHVTPQPPADFMLIGSPNSCDNPSIVGNYQVGKDFTSSNTITLNVSVITTGNYSITTDTINGINFSTSGSFTATGNQQVTLTANGAAKTPGLAHFTVKAGSSQCSFTVPIITSEPYATYVLESGSSGTSTVCAPESLQGTYISGKQLSGSNTVTITIYVRDLGNYCVSTDIANGISFSVTGAFTNTGEQSLVLAGTGTPTSSGTFTFTPQIVGPALIGGASCDFSVTVQ